jgi:hypothetical protein
MVVDSGGLWWTREHQQQQQQQQQRIGFSLEWAATRVGRRLLSLGGSFPRGLVGGKWAGATRKLNRLSVPSVPTTHRRQPPTCKMQASNVSQLLAMSRIYALPNMLGTLRSRGHAAAVVPWPFPRCFLEL